MQHALAVLMRAKHVWQGRMLERQSENLYGRTSGRAILHVSSLIRKDNLSCV